MQPPEKKNNITAVFLQLTITRPVGSLGVEECRYLLLGGTLTSEVKKNLLITYFAPGSEEKR